MPVEVNRLDNQVLVRYHETEWRAVRGPELTERQARTDPCPCPTPPAATCSPRSSACRPWPRSGVDSDAPPLPPGELVGPSDALGHRLRDGWRPVPAADAWESHGTVIVGGGVAGLAAAWRLARAGVTDFVLLELEPAPGGTSRGGESAVGPYPWGAHYIAAPLADNRLLIALLDEMGVVEGRARRTASPVIAEQVLCRDPEERVFFRGRWYEGLYLHAGESPEDVEQFRRFQAEIGRWAGWRDGSGRQAFAIPVAAGSDDPAVTDLDRDDDGRLARPARVHVVAAAVAGGLRLPRRLRGDRRTHQRLGRAVLLRLADAGAGGRDAAAADLARRQRPARAAPLRQGPGARPPRVGRRGREPDRDRRRGRRRLARRGRCAGCGPTG